MSSLIRKLINDAETYLGDTVDSAVITVPATLMNLNGKLQRILQY